MITGYQLGPRRSGRTLRSIEMCIQQAQRGGVIVFMSSAYTVARHAFEASNKALADKYPDMAWKRRNGKLWIESVRPNQRGRVALTHCTPAPMGERINAVIVDHYGASDILKDRQLVDSWRRAITPFSPTEAAS